MEKEIKYFKSWALFSILAIVVAMVAGAVAGAIVGFILGMAQASTETIAIISALLGFGLGIYASFYFYRWSIIKFILPQSPLSES